MLIWLLFGPKSGLSSWRGYRDGSSGTTEGECWDAKKDWRNMQLMFLPFGHSPPVSEIIQGSCFQGLMIPYIVCLFWYI